MTVLPTGYHTFTFHYNVCVYLTRGLKGKNYEYLYTE
jgi:hypothetical protein